MSIQHAMCDRCSCDIEYDDQDEDDDNGPFSGPEESEWEGCSLCAVCHEEVEVNGGADEEDMREPE